MNKLKIVGAVVGSLVALIAGTFAWFWLEEKKLDREWIQARPSFPRAIR